MRSPDRMVNMAKSRWPVRLIAKRVHRSPNTVSHAIATARSAGQIIPKAQTGYLQDGSIPLRVSGEALATMLAFAEATNVSPLDLCNAVLDHALNDINVVAAALRKDAPKGGA